MLNIEIIKNLLLIFIFLNQCLSWHILSEEFRKINFGLTGWTLNGSPLTTSNVVNECQTTLLKIEVGQILQKQFTFSYYEFSKIRVEMNAFFYDVVDSKITFNLAGTTFEYELYVVSTNPSISLCSNSAPSLQYLFNYAIDFNLQTIDFTLSFEASGHAGSFLGIRDFIIFTNSATAMNGCPLELSILNTNGECADKCAISGEQLSGHYLNKCISTNIPQSGDPLFFLSGIDSTTSDPTYISSHLSYYKLDYFTFTNTNQIYDQIYISPSGQELKVQIQGIIHLISWISGVSVTLNYNQEVDMFKISKTDSTYNTLPETKVSASTLTTSTTQISSMATEINSEYYIDDEEYYAVLLLQNLQADTVTYAFLNLNFYYAKGTKYCNNFVYNSFCISCDSPYWAYRGQCDDSCPTYTVKNTAKRRCVDLADYETQLTIPTLETNGKGYYLIKITDDDVTLQNDDIESIFINAPPATNNYQNRYKYSLLPDKKMIGGYNSWGYGSYVLQISVPTPHYQIRLFADLYLFDGWTESDQFQIYVDLALFTTITIQGLVGQQIYGLPQDDYFKQLFYRISHSVSTLTLEFNCRGSSGDASQASCGITNLFIMYDVDVTTLCSNSQFYSLTTNRCEDCDSKCLTSGCQLQATQCKCHYTCETCTGPLSSNCLTCSADFHREEYSVNSGTGCRCLCHGANCFTEIPNAGMCASSSSCHTTCQTCFELNNPNSCATCSSSNHRIEGINLSCVCESGYEDTGSASCSPISSCDISCDTCTVNNSSTNCSTCLANTTSHRTYNSSTHTCSCDDGYQESSPTQQKNCQLISPCHISCLLCSATNLANACLTCPNNSTSHRTYNSSLHTCICDQGYMEDSTPSQNCVVITSCDSSCELCSASNSSTSCVTCPDNSTSHRTYNSVSHTCPCDTNYIETDPVSVDCAMQCHKSCATCSAPNSSTNCSTCGDNSTTHRTYDGSNGCPCDDGYEEQNPINANCIVISPCHYSCELCSSSSDSNTCVSCPDNSVSHRTLVGSVCQCDSGYQDTTSQQNCVIQCHYSCETCSSPNSSTNCDSCVPATTSHRNYDNSAHTCKCENGYIEDGTNPNCKMDCHYSCLTCISPQDQNECSSCDNSMNRISGTNSDCPCKPGYEDVSNAALCTSINPCHETCYLCSVISSSNSCISCVPSQFRELNGSNECVCINGYQEQIGNPICSIQCHFTCLTCSIPNDANGCTTCPSSSTSHRINGMNNDCVCEVGYVEISNQLLCQMQCHYSCDACSLSNDQNACTQCNSSSHRSLVNQSCVCDNGYKEVIGQQNCILDCHFSCYTCSEAYLQNKCLDCPDQSTSHRMKDNNDQCICLTGYKEINQTNCEPICHTTCLTCYDVGENNCLSCDQSQNRTLNDGQCTCQAGYQANGAQCQVICHSSCLTCSGPLANQCLSCQISDISHRELYQNECKCQNDYMEVVGSAYCQLICMELCATCNVEDECLTCKSIDHLELQKSQCICADGYYLSNTKTLCLECSQNCSTCSSYDKCTSCNSEQNKSLANNKCVCKDQYWMKDENSNCISCNEDDGWLNEQCIKRDCGDGVYTFGEQCDDNNDDPRDGCDHCVRVQGFTCLNKPLQQSQCIKCGDNCKECMMDGKCILCNQGSQLENGNCQKCQDNCEVCKNQKCFKCLVIPQFISDNLTDNEKSKCPLCEDIEGLYTNPDGTDCIAKCGDQIVVSNAGEQCDDGNTIDNDGCSSLCQIEQGFECQDTQCIAIYPPTPSLISIKPPNNYTQERVLMLTYDSSLSSSVNVTNYLRFEIDGKYQNEDYFIQIQEQFNEFYQLKITLKLENSFIDDQFIILFENVEQIVGNNGLSQEIQSLSIGIYDFEYVSENVKLATQQVSDLNQYALYVLAAMICLAILLGGIDTFWNLLDLVQLLSYTNFIDTRYPYNLSKFLELFEFGQLRFLDNLIKMQDLVEFNINKVEIETYRPKGIFGNQVDTGLFIINISSTVTAFIIVGALYMISTIIFNTLTPIIKSLQKKYFSNESVLKRLFQFQDSVISYFKKYYKSFFWNVIIRTHMSTAYDISFAIFLQFQFDYSEMKSTIAKGSYVLCCLTCIFQFVSILFYLTKINISIGQFQQQQFQNNYGEAIFDTLEVRQLGKIRTYYNVFLLTKRFIHMLFLIYLYQVPSVQSICIGMLGMIHLLFLLFTQPLEQKAEFIKQIQCELLMYIMHMQIFILTFDDQLQILSEYGRLLIGWICVAEISLMVIIQLLIDIMQQFKYLIKTIPFVKKLYEWLVRKFRRQSNLNKIFKN